MSRWFRMYASDRSDPRVQALSPPLFKAWVGLMCLAAQRDGDLGSVEDIAASMRWRLDHALKHASSLLELGLLDSINGRFTPQGWGRRQWSSDVSKQRVAEFRKRAKERAGNGYNKPDVTVTVTDQEENRNITSSLSNEALVRAREAGLGRGKLEASETLRLIVENKGWREGS
jgi:hypothetical protein